MMNLDYILELLKITKERQTKGLRVPEETIAKTITVIEKIIAENDKMKNMGATAPSKEKPKDEIVNTEPFILQNQHEKEFWEKSYIAALNCGYENPPQQIADMAVCELRERLDEK